MTKQGIKYKLPRKKKCKDRRENIDKTLYPLMRRIQGDGDHYISQTGTSFSARSFLKIFVDLFDMFVFVLFFVALAYLCSWRGVWFSCFSYRDVLLFLNYRIRGLVASQLF